MFEDERKGVEEHRGETLSGSHHFRFLDSQVV
jgi:hypothetical protein